MRLSKYILIALIAVSALSGCKTQERIVEKTRTDTLYINKIQYDSISYRDTVMMRADTLILTKWRERWSTRIDTVMDTKIIRNDSIVYQERTVQAEKSWFDIVCRNWFWVSLVIIVLWIAWIVVKKFVLKKE